MSSPSGVPDGSSGTQGGAVAGYKDAEVTNQGFIQYVIAWSLVLILVLLLNRTKWGHALIYYGLALSLLILVLANYRSITELLAPASQPSSDDEAPVPEAPGDASGGNGGTATPQTGTASMTASMIVGQNAAVGLRAPTFKIVS
jgi:hypothetical protein